MTIGFGQEHVRPEDLDTYDLPALTREAVLAVIPDAGSTRAAVAELLGVPEHSADLANLLFHLAEDRKIAVHGDGTIRHLRAFNEE